MMAYVSGTWDLAEQIPMLLCLQFEAEVVITVYLGYRPLPSL